MNIEKYNKLHTEIMKKLENGEITTERAKEINDLAYDKYITEKTNKTKTYDKASWHIDNGINEKEVISKFEILFKFLKKHNMLTDDGIEIFKIGIDNSVIITSNMLTIDGNKFMTKYYDTKLINITSNNLLSKLEELYGSGSNN
jgi:hypothetical protein